MAIALDRSKQHLDFIIAQAQATNGYMNHKDVNSTPMLSLVLIQRQADRAQAIRLLIDKIIENQHLEFGVGPVV
jgi:hypothetical protein